MSYPLSLSAQPALAALMVPGNGDPGALPEPPGILYLDELTGNVWLSNITDITTGLVQKWDLDTFSPDISSGTIADRSGHGNTGALVGSPTVDATGMHLDGSGSVYAVSNASATTLTGDRAMAIWLLPTSSAGNIALWSAGNGTTGVLINYFQGTVFWSAFAPGTVNFINSGLGLNLHAWNLIVLSWEDATGTLTLYVNGIKFTGATTNNPWSLGSIYVGHDGPHFGVIDFTGSVGQMKIWNRQLSSVEAASVLANPPPSVTGVAEPLSAWTQVGQITAIVPEWSDPGAENVSAGVTYFADGVQQTGTRPVVSNLLSNQVLRGGGNLSGILKG